MSKTSNYWDKRALVRLNEAEKHSEIYINRIKKIYNQAYKNIKKEIENVYLNYSKDTGVDVQKLKELLTKKETDKVWKTLKRQGLDKYIKNNYKSRISRLEQIQAQIYAEAKKIYPKEELEQNMCYKGIINNSYYKAVYDTQMGVGYNFSFTKIDKNIMNTLLQDNWSGKNYSERIWGNTDILADSLSELIGGALISGQSIAKTSKQIRDRFNVAKYYSDRLVRTEVNHFNNAVDAMAYENMGINKYVFVATLDSRTSEICQEMDNKVFEYKDKEVGVNFPPLHPNCRSKTRGYLGEKEEKMLKRRARNPITGKNEIIDNMSYEEWLKKNFKTQGKENVEKAIKNTKNKSNDKKQYEKYLERLKDSEYVPDSIEKFVEMKYNTNTDVFKSLKREYKTIGKINEKSDNITRDIEIYYDFRKSGLETTQHFISDYYDRMYDGKNNMKFNFEKIIDISKKVPNYFDTETNRNVRYYDKIVLISEKDTNEMVSMRYGKGKKTWKKI